MTGRYRRAIFTERAATRSKEGSRQISAQEVKASDSWIEMIDELRVQAEGCHVEPRLQTLQCCSKNWNLDRSQGDLSPHEARPCCLWNKAQEKGKNLPCVRFLSKFIYTPTTAMERENNNPDSN